jgi:hypothetical protein
MQKIISYFPENYFDVRNVIITFKHPCGSSKNTDPYAIKLSPVNKLFTECLWDITAFRPNILDNVELIKKLKTNTAVEATVFYENMKCFSLTDDINNKVCETNIPRYIIYENYIFVNIR